PKKFLRGQHHSSTPYTRGLDLDRFNGKVRPEIVRKIIAPYLKRGICRRNSFVEVNLLQNVGPFLSIHPNWERIRPNRLHSCNRIGYKHFIGTRFHGIGIRFVAADFNGATGAGDDVGVEGIGQAKGQVSLIYLVPQKLRFMVFKLYRESSLRPVTISPRCTLVTTCLKTSIVSYSGIRRACVWVTHRSHENGFNASDRNRS